MINYIIRLVICGIVVFLLPRFLADIEVKSVTDGIIVAFIMSILNTFVKPILKLISFPVTFLTLGLFSFVITFAIVHLCDYLVEGFKVNGFLISIIFSIILAITNGFLGLFKEDKK
jgi:putative membrane protein